MSENIIQPDGPVIERARKAAGMTQTLLAEKTGLGIRTIQKAESSERVQVETVETIAQAVGCRADEFLPVEERNKKVIQRIFLEVMNHDRYELIKDCYTEDVIGHDPSHGAVGYGRDHLLDVMKQYRAAFPDYRFRIEEMVAERDWVAARWTNFATHHGELAGYRPSGRRAITVGISLARLVDGKVKQVWQYQNFAGLLESIEAVPKVEKVLPHEAIIEPSRQ